MGIDFAGIYYGNLVSAGIANQNADGVFRHGQWKMNPKKIYFQEEKQYFSGMGEIP